MTLCGHGFVQSGGNAQCFCTAGIFPGQIDIVATEVSVRCGLAIDGPAQVQVMDDGAGAQIEVFLPPVRQCARR